jgi:preprotein translocase subunit SecA
MFEALMDSIWEEYTRLIFHVNVEIQPAQVDEQMGPVNEPENVTYSGGTESEQPSALRQAASGAGALAAADAAASAPSGKAAGVNPDTVVKADHDKVGRNDPCWCGSGKKFKKCHGR